MERITLAWLMAELEREMQEIGEGDDGEKRW